MTKYMHIIALLCVGTVAADGEIRARVQLKEKKCPSKQASCPQSQCPETTTKGSDCSTSSSCENRSCPCPECSCTECVCELTRCGCNKPKPKPKPPTTPAKKNEPMKKRTRTATGLEYTVLKSAEAGAQKPAKGSSVEVHYTGWLADANGEPMLDKKFDSSRDRNQPLVVQVGMSNVIRGFDEALMNMSVGERRMIHIPANLAYGARAIGDMIPANSMLVFDLELVSVR